MLRFLAGCALSVRPTAAPAQVASSAVAPATAGADALDTLLHSADVNHRRGRLAEARAALAAADSVASRTGGSAVARARLWIALGSVWVSQTAAGNSGYAEADAAATRALEFARQSKDPRLLADAYDLAGRVLYSRRINLAEGDYEKPLGYFRQALALRRQVGDERGVVESLFRVGLIHERNDEDTAAVAVYQEAMRMAGNQHPLERSNLARHLAYQYQGRGDYDRALALFRQSLALRQQAGVELTRAPALNSIGDLYRRMKRYDEALDYNRSALAEAERLGARRFMVMALVSIGQTHAAVSQRGPAIEHLRWAEALADEIGYVSGLEQAREALAEVEAR